MARKIPTWVLVLGLAGAYWWLKRTVTPAAPSPTPTLAQSITNLFGTGS